MTVYVIRYRVTDEREWETNGGNSYRGWLLLLDGVASTFENGCMLSTAHYLSDANEDKPITWTTRPGEVYGIIRDGGYVTEYLIDARKVITVKTAADTLNYQRSDFNRRNAS